MFRRKSGAPNASGVAPTQRGSFPTFRRLLGRSGRFGFLFPTFRRLLGRLPFLSRAWWKRNKRRVAAACLILAAIWTATDVYATALLNRELEAIRQRGEPLTMAELAPPPVADKDNAAVLYKRADATLKKLGFTQDEEIQMMGQDPKTNAMMSAPQLSAARRRLLQKYRPAIERIRQASRLSSCVFPRDWNQPAFEILFPELAYLRKFARLMSASAIQEAQDGQTSQAIADVGVIYRISEHATSDPILISLLVSIAIENVGHNALAQVFEYSNLTPAQKSAVEAILPRSDREQDLARALRGERAFGLSGFNATDLQTDVLRLTDESDQTSLLDSSLFRVAHTIGRPIFKLDEVWYLRSHPANPHPVPFQDIPRYAALTRILMPVFERLHQTIDKAETNRSLAQVALDLNVYHTQNKSYPATLAQLEAQRKTKLPLDPFSGKPFFYRRTKNDYDLYSVGVNKRDDDGRTEDDWNRSPRAAPQSPDGSWLASEWDDITWPPRKRRQQ